MEGGRGAGRLGGRLGEIRGDRQGFESMKVDDRTKETTECLDRDFVCTLVSLFPSLNINDYESYGCTEYHYVLVLFLGFRRSLATLEWINC